MLEKTRPQDPKVTNLIEITIVEINFREHLIGLRMRVVIQWLFYRLDKDQDNVWVKIWKIMICLYSMITKKSEFELVGLTWAK